MSNIRSKILLVEGDEDKRVIPELMEANGVEWEKKNLPVYIDSIGGFEKLTAELVQAELQKPGLTHLGIIVDADDEKLVDVHNRPTQRWQSLRDTCYIINDLPKELPKTGLLHRVNNKNISQNSIRFGIWIMPDNNMRGMLETFLAYLIRNESDELWDFAKQSVQKAKGHKAPFTDVQTDKANIYTWLAWQDPPGRQLHDAVKQRILDPKHHTAQSFVEWFKALYEL